MTSVASRLTALEDNFTERKLSGVRPADLRRTLVAFANSVPADHTAILFIGVNNDGTPVGVPDPDGTQKTVRNAAEKDCYPPIHVRSEVITVDGKHVVAVEIAASDRRPHFAGSAYVRRGSESVVASDQIFDELVASRNSKAGALLQEKGKVLTVMALRKELGSTKYLGDTQYRARHECRIEAVTAHFVRMHDVSTGTNITEPLEHVTVSYDEERYRPMLVVQPIVR